MNRKSRACRRLPLKRQPAPCLTLDTPAHLAHTVSVLGLFVLRGLLVTLAVRQPFVITNGPSSSRVAMNVLRRVLNSDRSGGSSAHSDHCSARVSTRSWNCATFGDIWLIEKPASVRSRRNGSSTADQNSPAEPKVVAGAAELVENGPRPSVASAKGLVALPQAGSTRVLCSSFK